MKVRRRKSALGALALAVLASCSEAPAKDLGPSTFHVTITSINGSGELPTADKPLPANRGDTFDTWTFDIEARSPTGRIEPFDGMVRLSTRPGAVVKVSGDGAIGRNIRLEGGKASGAVTVTAVYGPSRLWAEDIGYVPAPFGKMPACSNGKNDDAEEDVLIDFPADPGCAYANDDTEEGGSYEAGVSAPVEYALPTISDIQGDGSTTPYPFEGIEINSAPPQRLVITRVASDGFYVTDVSPAEVMGGYNSLFAFNFSTPPGMRVCDRVSFLSGTVNEFFGFTELSFPSFTLDYPIDGKDACEVPEPTVIDATTITNADGMEKLESGLVRIQSYHVAKHFGPELAKNNVFVDPKDPSGVSARSNCDFNGNGQVDFERKDEGSCANACSADPECSEWNNYSARGNYKVSKGASMIQIQTGTASGFNPRANRGVDLDAVTGTLRNFSGGSLNWTIEVRCSDDLVCASSGCTCEGCAAAVLSSQKACVHLRSIDDNDQGTN
jgi:hypothetical protein